MEKTFSEKKSANQSFDNCLAYFKAIRAQLVAHQEMDKALNEYVFTSNGKVYWLSIRKYSRTLSQISLIGRDLAQTPLELWSEVEYRVAKEYGLDASINLIPFATTLDEMQD